MNPSVGFFVFCGLGCGVLVAGLLVGWFLKDCHDRREARRCWELARCVFDQEAAAERERGESVAVVLGLAAPDPRVEWSGGLDGVDPAEVVEAAELIAAEYGR